MIDLRDRRPVHLGQAEEEVVVDPFLVAQGRLRMHVNRFVFGVRPILGGTDVHAEIAARAVFWRHLNRVALALELVAFVRRGLERLGRARERALLVHLRANRGVRADERALVALDANLGVPDRDLDGKIPLLPFRRGDRPRAVDGKGADGQQVAFAGQHDGRHLLHEVGRAFGDEGWTLARRGRCSRDADFVQVGERLIHDLAVAPHHLRAALAVRLLDALLDVRDRFVLRE